MKTARLILFFALAVATLTGCATWPSARTIEWKEEVAFSGGLVVIVERKEDYIRVGEPGRGSGWLFSRGSLQAKLVSPSLQLISWEGLLDPLALDMVGEDVYFVGVVTAKAERELRIRDGSFLYAMRLGKDGFWQSMAVADLPRQVQRNLLVSKHDVFFSKHRSVDQIVTIEEKRSVDVPSRVGDIRQNIPGRK